MRSFATGRRAIITQGKNANLLVITGSCLQAAKTIVSPHIVLPWVVVTLGAPPALVAIILPLWRGARIASRLMFATWIDRRTLLRPVLLSTAVSRLLLLGLLFAALASGEPGFGVAAALIVALGFGATDGIGTSVGRRQMSKLIPAQETGRLVSLQILVGAGLVIVLASTVYGLNHPSGHPDMPAQIGLAALCLAIGGLATFLISERPSPPREQRERRPGLASLALLREVPWVARYTLACAFGITISMTPSFFALIAARSGLEAGAVLLFVVAQMLGSMIGGLVTARIIDRDPSRVIVAAFAILSVASLAMMAIEVESARHALLVYLPVFLLAGAARAGYLAVEARTLISGADSGTIASVTAASGTVSTVVGVALGFSLGLMADQVHAEMAIGFLVGAQIAGAVLWVRLLGRTEPILGDV